MLCVLFPLMELTELHGVHASGDDAPDEMAVIMLVLIVWHGCFYRLYLVDDFAYP